jgi:biotin carboxylase
MKPRLLLLVPTSTYRAEAFVRSAQRLALDLSIASEVPSSLSHLHPVDLPAFDFNDPVDAVAKARALVATTRVDGVVSVDDQSVLPAAEIARALGLHHHSPDGVRAALSKFLGRERMREAGIDVPAYRLLAIDDGPARAAAQIKDGLGYPVVLKPLAMAASRGVVRVNRAGDLKAAFERLAALVRSSPSRRDPLANDHILAESYVPGFEVAVEGLVDRGGLHVFAIFDKVDPLEGPYFPETMYVTPSRLDAAAQARIIDVTGRTVRAYGLDDGPVHVELRIDGSRVVPIEAHARSIGGLCSRVLRFEGDRSLEELIILHALGLLGKVPAREPLAAGVWMMQAPRGGTFVHMRGVAAACEVPGVDEVIVSARPAQPLSPLPDGFLYLGFIFARAVTPGRVEAALRQAFSRLEPVFEDAA